MTALRFPLLFLASASLLGCQPDPPTLRTAKPTDPPPATLLELKPPTKPAQSSPEAQKKLDAMLAVHSGGKPERLQLLKSCSFTRTGGMALNGTVGAATQTVDVQWPARFRHSTEVTGETVGIIAGGLTPEGNWLSQSSRPFGEAAPKALPKQKLPDELLLTLQRQMQEDACFLLFPFADPQARALLADDAKLGDRDCYGLHVWTPALEYALLHIDKKTDALVRMAFTGHESGKNVLKELLIDDSPEFAGVKLGSKVYVRAAGIDLAEWRSLKVTGGKTFDAKSFDGP